MKVYAISDLHISLSGDKPMDIFGSKWVGYIDKIKSDWNNKVTEEDIVLISGDHSWAMKLENAVTDLALLADLKGKKVIIRGNHDYWWSGIGKVREKLPQGFYALQNDSVKFERLIICGSRGWSLEETSEQDKKLVNREVERFRLALKDASKKREEGDKLICMIHYPPFNINREDSPFTQLFEEYKVNAVVYGHLHGRDCKAELVVNKNGIPYYLTSCDLLGNTLTEINLGEDYE